MQWQFFCVERRLACGSTHWQSIDAFIVLCDANEYRMSPMALCKWVDGALAQLSLRTQNPNLTQLRVFRVIVFKPSWNELELCSIYCERKYSQASLSLIKYIKNKYKSSPFFFFFSKTIPRAHASIYLTHKLTAPSLHNRYRDVLSPPVLILTHRSYNIIAPRAKISGPIFWKLEELYLSAAARKLNWIVRSCNLSSFS